MKNRNHFAKLARRAPRHPLQRRWPGSPQMACRYMRAAHALHRDSLVTALWTLEVPAAATMARCTELEKCAKRRSWKAATLRVWVA